MEKYIQILCNLREKGISMTSRDELAEYFQIASTIQAVSCAFWKSCCVDLCNQNGRWNEADNESVSMRRKQALFGHGSKG